MVSLECERVFSLVVSALNETRFVIPRSIFFSDNKCCFYTDSLSLAHFAIPIAFEKLHSHRTECGEESPVQIGSMRLKCKFIVWYSSFLELEFD